MNARDEILGRVRAALADAPAPPAVPRDYRQSFERSVLDLFVERVEDYRAVVSRCASDQVEERVVAILDGARTVVPPELPWQLPHTEPDTGQSALELDEFDAVVTAAAVGIAVTGTVVLDHGPGQGRRALSLVPDLHVCVVRADQVVAGVPEAVARLDAVRPQTWISGPSATSDIELNRVEGVHGPRTLHVVLVS
ncbi:MAG TPA: LUD domain-containing protein [Marmoricola sp.]|nr:LUD domain-containing protein [Marmoricola sp.]